MHFNSSKAAISECRILSGSRYFGDYDLFGDDALGYITQAELSMLEKVLTVNFYGQYYVPINWALCLCSEMYEVENKWKIFKVDRFREKLSTRHRISQL